MDFQRRPRMVQKSTFQNIDIFFKSELDTLNNILSQLISIAFDMQQNILKQKWNKVFELAESQKEVNCFFDEAIKDIKTNFQNNKNKNNEITKIKDELINKIARYKELEFINAKLLDDSLYTAKQKINKIFKAEEKRTYSKNIKKESNLWSNSPIILDSFV